MALLDLNSFEEIEKHQNHVHKPVHATYTSFSKDGRKYFQIDTYGTDERLMPGKLSQSIQIDKDMAVHLIGLLKEQFKLD